jgi:hypothetical protein
MSRASKIYLAAWVIMLAAVAATLFFDMPREHVRRLFPVLLVVAAVGIGAAWFSFPGAWRAARKRFSKNDEQHD